MNRVALSVELLERGALRHTPAGLPALDLRLAHASRVHEAGAPRQIAFEIRALALGEMAGQAAQWALGQGLEVEGFLGPAIRGSGLRLHLTAFRPTSSVSTLKHSQE